MRSYYLHLVNNEWNSDFEHTAFTTLQTGTQGEGGQAQAGGHSVVQIDKPS